MTEPRDLKRDRDRRHDVKRREEKPWRAWYKTKLWLTRRAVQLAMKPLCERCEKRGRTTPANTANHKVPHRGDWALFSTGELESLCGDCHNTDARATDARGYSNDIDPATGFPIDPAHPWFKGGG